MKDVRFEELRESIFQEMLKANQHFKIFWELKKAPYDISKIMNVYIVFFNFTMWSHNDRFCLAIYNVIKPYDDTANFQKLFNYIKSHSNLSQLFPSRIIEDMEAKIKSHYGLICKIKTVRDQYVAHKQLKKKHLDEIPITYTYEEGSELLKDLNKILNDVSYKYDNSTYWLDDNGLMYVSPGLNVEDMLRHLTEYRKESTKRRIGGASS